MAEITEAEIAILVLFVVCSVVVVFGGGYLASKYYDKYMSNKMKKIYEKEKQNGQHKSNGSR